MAHSFAFSSIKDKQLWPDERSECGESVPAYRPSPLELRRANVNAAAEALAKAALLVRATPVRGQLVCVAVEYKSMLSYDSSVELKRPLSPLGRCYPVNNRGKASRRTRSARKIEVCAKNNRTGSGAKTGR